MFVQQAYVHSNVVNKGFCVRSILSLKRNILLDTWCFLRQWKWKRKTHKHTHTHSRYPNQTKASDTHTQSNHYGNAAIGNVSESGFIISATEKTRHRKIETCVVERDREKHWHPAKIKINWQKLFAVSFRKVFIQFSLVRQSLRFVKSRKPIVKHPQYNQSSRINFHSRWVCNLVIFFIECVLRFFICVCIIYKHRIRLCCAFNGFPFICLYIYLSVCLIMVLLNVFECKRWWI